jgi:DNA polymerase-3 subunit epsilon
MVHDPGGAVVHPPSTVSFMPPAFDIRPGFAVVDLETTGFSPQSERVVEVAVVVLDLDGREVDAFCTLIDPQRDPGPTHIHGITAEMLEGAPTFGGVHPYLAGLLSGRVVVGHNVDQFDLAFLVAECRRLGGDDLVPAAVVTLDTLRVAQSYLDLPGKARLVDCCDRYQLTWDDHHSALGDARITAALLGAMRAELGDDMLDVDQLLQDSREQAWPGWTDHRPVAHGRSHTPAA